MSFSYFNSAIGYFGQDLHILRNGKDFYISHFVYAPVESPSIQYSFKAPFSSTTNSYENIVVSLVAGNRAKINALPYDPNQTDKKLSCFFVEITINGETGKILIHIHDSMEKVWLSPETLSLRNHYDKIRFGVFAKFDNCVSANISWYEGIKWTKTNFPSYLDINDGTGIISIIDANSWPATDPPESEVYQVGITLPANLASPGVIIDKGRLKVSTNNGELFLVSGDVSKVSTRKNLLFLSDGYTIDEKNKFKKQLKNLVQKQFNKSNITMPWNLFKEDFNYWGYFLASREGGGILEGDYILVDEDPNNPKSILISQYITIADKLLLDLRVEFTKYTDLNTHKVSVNPKALSPLNSPTAKLKDYRQYNYAKSNPTLNNFFSWASLAGSESAAQELLFPIFDKNVTYLNVQWLYDNAGLPGQDDLLKDIDVKRDELVAFGIENFKVGDETTFPGDKYLSSFVYQIWLQMINRISMCYPDTAFGTYRLNSSEGCTVHKFRNFKYKQSLNIFLSYNMVDSETQLDLGSHFFDHNGVPVLDPENNPQNSSFMVILSKTPLLGISGRNSYTEEVGIAYKDRIVVCPVFDEKSIINPCVYNSTSNLDHIVTSNMDVNSLKFPPKNAIIHELGHSLFLLDEYSLVDTELKSESDNTQATKVTTETLQSNLQTKQDILIKIANNQKGWGDNIKWMWPRIEKVNSTAGPIEHISGNQYNIPVIPLDPNKSIFDDEDLVLLRKRELFDEKDYPKFKILDASNPSKIKVESQTPFTATNYPTGSLLIMPVVDKSAPNSYYRVVHPYIIAKLNAEAAPIVDIFQPPGNAIQRMLNVDSNLPDFPFLEKIVGLYAGGGGAGDFGTFGTGIYHPAGFCLMRQTDLETANSYCHICRYILVDNINPLKHPDIDKEYSKEYPTN